MEDSRLIVEEQVQPTAPVSKKRESGGLIQAIPGLFNICGFNLFYVGSFAVITSAPITLMVRHWGAGELLIGFLVALMPASHAVQIFVAPYIERVRIKRYILIGLFIRNSFYMAVALLPFFVHGGIVGPAKALYGLMLFMIFVDFSHGIGLLPWFTWLSQLVPENWRGRYFSVEQIVNNVSVMLLALFSGFMIGAEKNNLRFGIYLILGAILAWIGLFFISRVPSVPVLKPATDGKRINPFNLGWVPAMLKNVALRRMLYVIIANQFMASMGTFGILFSTEDQHLRQDILMKLGAIAPVGSILAVYMWGSLSDRFGTRPVIILGYRMVVLNCLVTFLVALFMPMNPIFLYTIGVTFGLVFNVGYMCYAINNFRYLLCSVPKEQVPLASVLYGLTVQLTFAIWPPIWGKLLQCSAKLHIVYGPFYIHRYSCLYGGMLVASIVTLLLMYRLENRDSEATPNEVMRYAFKQTPGVVRSFIASVVDRFSMKAKG